MVAEPVAEPLANQEGWLCYGQPNVVRLFVVFSYDQARLRLWDPGYEPAIAVCVDKRQDLRSNLPQRTYYCPIFRYFHCPIPLRI